ncbi:adhesion G protein-coupled receptor B2 [Diretmus argenteus]
MNTAGGVCLSVLSSFLAVAGALATVSALTLGPFSALAVAAYGATSGVPSAGAEGALSPVSSLCSSLVAGVLYGSFSLRELFPSRAPGCSWSLENPDPTKYSLYLRFTRHPAICLTHAPMLLSLDHHQANQSCPLHLQMDAPSDQEVIDLCGSQSNSEGTYSFLQFDKNFVQLCLTRHPAAEEPQVTKDMLELRLVEVLLINNENSSQFTCGVLCRWFEECLRTSRHGDPEVSNNDGCGMTQTGCVCPNHNIMVQPIPLLPATPHSFSNGSLVPDDCCVTELHSNDAIAIAPRDVRQDPYDDDLKVKTQRPRSADQPGVFQAQTGDPAAEEWSQWSVCSLTCGQGWQVRTRSCVSSPYGTLCSGALRETRMCNNTASCPGEPGITGSVEGQWLDWGPWSRCSVTCNTGTQQRQRRCSASVHGWAECKGPHQENRECTNPSCGGGGNWGSWNHWSLCSKTCDSGWQRRFRMCEGTGIQGYPCDGSGEEVRSCNEKKCPAPHEICKDEHLLSMTWKRASAGETVYNKCPTNATGSASRRCMLDNNGVAFWGPPSFARCVSLEYRYLHLSLREHLAKGQRTLAGEGMSQIVRSLLELLQRRSYYSGDLLFSTEILRNVTDTFKRATYIPAPDDVQKFFQVVSYMLDMENIEKWEDAHQVSPGAAMLMRILEDFIHLIGEAQKPFQSFLVVTNNLMITIQREPVSAVSSDINFPMKGRRGMKDWARTAEDKLYIPKEVFTISAEETEAESEATMYYVIGAILYRTLGVILPAPNPPAVINSKILTVTVRPEPQPSEPMVVVELSLLLNGTSDPQCAVWDYGNPEAAAENWGREGCQTLASTAVHTKCLCSRISTYAVLAQQAKDPVNMLIGIVVFNKLMSRDGISDKSKKQRAGVPAEARSRLLLKCSKCGVISSTALSSSTARSAMASLWSSCVVLPLLALTWMSAVLAITDRRSTLFQVLFAVFDSVQGFVIITIHCAMRREVQDAVRCRMGGCKDDSENSPDSCKNGQVQIMKCPNVSYCGQQCSSLRYGTSPCPPGCHQQPFPPTCHQACQQGCQQACYHSLPRSNHSHGHDHSHTLSQLRDYYPILNNAHNHAHNYSSSLPTDFEKDVDLACQTERGHPFIFKEVNTCNPATITGTLSRISLDDEDDPKLAAHQEGGVGVNFSSLPGNIPPPNLIVQVPTLGGLNELSETPLKKEVNVEQQRQQGQQRSGAPVYLCTESGLGWARPPTSSNTSQDGSAGSGGGGEGDYMVLPRRTVSLKPPVPSQGGGLGLGGEDKPLNIAVEDPPFPPPPSPLTLHPAESEAYPVDFVPPSVGDMNIAMNLNRSYGTIKTMPHGHGHMMAQGGLVHSHGGHMHSHGHSLQLKPGQRPSVRQILTGGSTVERTRTLPRNLGSTNANSNLSAGSLERKRVRYSELDFEKVMHTRKRHSELYHELNHSSKFHTIDRYSRDPAMSTFKDKSTPEDQHSWDNFKTMTPELSIVPGEQKDRMELHNKTWDSSSANTPDSSEGDFQTEV